MMARPSAPRRGSDLATKRRDGWAVPVNHRALRDRQAQPQRLRSILWPGEIFARSVLFLRQLDRARAETRRGFCPALAFERRPDSIGLSLCGRNTRISKGASMTGGLGRLGQAGRSGPKIRPQIRTGGGQPPPLLNQGMPLPGGKGTTPPVGSGAAAPPLGGGGMLWRPRVSQAPNFKQGVDHQNIPTGGQYPCPILTTRCLEAIWRTYFDEHYYALGAQVADLDGSSTPPKPKLKTEPDYHPCANFGIVLAQYELENGKEAATDRNQLMERIADLKAYAWELGLPFSSGFDY
jgi:hypothetical protein